MRMQERCKNMWEMWDVWERVKDMKTLEKYENASETWECGRDENTLKIYSLRKQPTFLWRYHWFPHQKTSEKRAQKFHTDDASLLRPE